MADRLAKLIATFFYCGQSPWAPGTVGSLAGLLLYTAIAHDIILTAVFFVVLCVAGFFAADRAERIFGKKDPGAVVIDEVCGVFPAFFLLPLTWVNIVAGFALYRLFDIVKPFPARRLEKLPGAWGIMSDDILCGLYTNLALHLLAGYGFLKV